MPCVPLYGSPIWWLMRFCWMQFVRPLPMSLPLRALPLARSTTPSPSSRPRALLLLALHPAAVPRGVAPRKCGRRPWRVSRVRWPLPAPLDRWPRPLPTPRPPGPIGLRPPLLGSRVRAPLSTLHPPLHQRTSHPNKLKKSLQRFTHTFSWYFTHPTKEMSTSFHQQCPSLYVNEFPSSSFVGQQKRRPCVKCSRFLRQFSLFFKIFFFCGNLWWLIW